MVLEVVSPPTIGPGAILGVLSTINLNDQICFKAEKIQHIWTHRHLAFEFPAIDLPVSETAPEHSLGVRLPVSQFACEFDISHGFTRTY